MSRLAFRENGIYKGIVTYSEKKYTEDELKKMHDEFIEIENELKTKCKNEYDSEYSYELGLILSQKLKEYEIVESTRFYFWQILREGVNTNDKRKVFQFKQRDPYEYDYLLSKLPKELVVKFSRSKWDHLFDITTTRKDARLFDWLLNVENEMFINNQNVFQNFCKGVKDIIEKIDTNMLTDEELFEIYNEVMNKSIVIVKYMKDNSIKLDSSARTRFFKESKNIKSSEESDLINLLDEIKKSID
ncbi:MAG: hypothetical protein PUA68_07985 [Bacilli bacterium]|nr:hypothetical protein [Bacilli bacterium]